MFKKARYVYSVYIEGSFTRAAEKLYVSQPCLSKAIKELEEELGTPIFERGSGAVKPTELGLKYIKTAEKIIELEDSFSLLLKDETSLKSGLVRVGGTHYMTSYVLPLVIDTFSKRYPGVTVTLTEASSSELTKLLKNGEVDLIVDSFDSEPTDMSYIPLVTERILLAVPSCYECNERIKGKGVSPRRIFEGSCNMDYIPSVKIDSFKDEKFILLKSGNSMYDHAMTVFKEAGFTPSVSLFLDQLSTAFFLATEGNGICFITDTVCRYHSFDDSVLLYNIKEGGTRTLGVASKKKKSVAVKKFIEVLSDKIK